MRTDDIDRERNFHKWELNIYAVGRDIDRGIKPQGYEPAVEKLRREEAEKRARRVKHG
jgi:hypothetical protein